MFARKILAVIIASAFAGSVFAQAPAKADAKAAPAVKAEAKADAKAAPAAKTEAKAEAKKGDKK